MEYWYGQLGDGVFQKCPQTKCYLINNSKYADAVLISHNYLTSFQNIKLPGRSSPQQKWIFYSIESPQHFDIKPQYLDVFNGTFTYRESSDAYRPYGKVIPRVKKRKRQYYDKNWLWKHNIAWAASNCPTKGGREIYVKELAKYIDVAIYGKCGTLTCPHGLARKCQKYLENSYKFYLSFENSLCAEYATEKLFGILNTDMIPIVYGLFDCKNNLPERSFIDVRDFRTPRHLAEYLKMLSNNKTLYDSYFTWKEDFVVHGTFLTSGLCNLCEHLHRTKNSPPYTVNLAQYWAEDTNCMRKEQFLRSVGVLV